MISMPKMMSIIELKIMNPELSMLGGLKQISKGIP